MRILRYISIVFLFTFGVAQERILNFPVVGSCIQLPHGTRENFYSLAFFSTGVRLPYQIERLGNVELLLSKVEHNATYPSRPGEGTEKWCLRRESRDGFLILSHSTWWGEFGSMKSVIKLKLVTTKVQDMRLTTVIPVTFNLKSTTYRDSEVVARLEKMMGKELFTIETKYSDPVSVEGIVALTLLRASTLAPQRFCE